MGLGVPKDCSRSQELWEVIAKEVSIQPPADEYFGDIKSTLTAFSLRVAFGRSGKI